eukprot:11546293-Prorocentrum_lima.AAC.1
MCSGAGQAFASGKTWKASQHDRQRVRVGPQRHETIQRVWLATQPLSACVTSFGLPQHKSH